MNLGLIVLGGESIDHCAKEAVRLARLLDVGLEFHFNGVCCIASPHGDPEVLVENYRRCIDGGLVQKYATCYKREAE